MQIRTKLSIAVVLSMGSVAAVAGSIIRDRSERNIHLFSEAAVSSAEGAFRSIERAEVQKLSATLAAILADTRYLAPFRRRDRAGLMALATPLFQELRASHWITHWYFHLPDRTCLLRVHAPEQFGDPVERPTLAKAAETRRLTAGMELGKTAFALRAVQPWIVDGELLGYVELGQEIDGFLERMKGATGNDYALLVEKRHLDRGLYDALRRRAGQREDWDDLATAVSMEATAVGASMQAWKGDVSSVPATGTYLGEAVDEGRTFARGGVPIADASGHRVGLLVVRADMTVIHDNMTRARTGVIVIVMGLSAVAAGILVVLLNALVFARLRRTTTLLEDVSARLVGGDYDLAGAVPPAAWDDEIGGFETFFGRFIAVVAETLKGLTERRR
jgi:hypothetical protein